MTKNYFVLLCFFLLLKAACMVWVIMYAGVGLGPDEAQYWTWSRHLDWGYYSKPPGIAWQIWLGSGFFGNTELGVRSPAVVIGLLLPLTTYFLAKACHLHPATCFWAGMCMAFAPLGILSSFFAITDGGMVVFWTAACACIAAPLHKRLPPPYLLLGLLILCGALFKWPIFLLWIFVLGQCVFYPSFFSWKLFAGIGISLLGLVPSVIWNASHGWVTFRHVYFTVVGRHDKEIGTTGLPQGNFFDFLGAQAALLSPILFILLMLAFWAMVKNRKTLSPALLFCGWITLLLIFCYSFLAFFMKMQGNWSVFAYPTGIVLLCWYACEKLNSGRLWIIGGLALGVLFSLATFSIPYFQSHDLVSRFPIPYRVNPFRHNLGWGHLQQELKAAGYNSSTDFLFGDKYQTTSILSFYGENQKRAYFLNLQGMRKNQFSFWPGMTQEQKGKKGFFVVTENIPHLNTDLIAKYQSLLQPYFSQVRFIDLKPLFLSYGTMAKGVLIFECKDYNGKQPPEVELY
jgi:Dolichyl-phosphate-mannose-protein mannosyltransferase